MKLRSIARLSLMTVAICMAVATCVAGVPGCAASPQAKVDQAEILYGQTLGAANDAYRVGLISPATYHDVVTPLRQTARKEIDSAKLAVASGNFSVVDALLATARDALLQIQAQKAKAVAPATRPSSIGPPVPAATPMQAVVDPISAGLLILGLINRLGPVAQKLFSGQELTPEERALAEKVSADATAEADVLDADAAGKL